ncbi:MAG: FMN reductase [Burkholderiaceae bacterium]
MSDRLNVIAVSGSPNHPSKTDTLLNAVIAELGSKRPVDARSVRLSALHPELGATLQRPGASRKVADALDLIEGADLLVVGTPVYRGAYSGLFKHLFDLVHQDALRSKPVMLVATGGSERHSLVIDHQLRPLFAFFQSLPLPLGVYGTDRDFADGRIASDALSARIALAVQYALPWLDSHRAERPEPLRLSA